MRSHLPLSLSFLLWTGTTAGAQPPTDTHARNLAASCSNCHAAPAHGEAVVRPLAGMPAADLARAMQEFRAGSRPGTVMPQLAKGYTDAQIEAIAQWYGAQRP